MIMQVRKTSVTTVFPLASKSCVFISPKVEIESKYIQKMQALTFHTFQLIKNLEEDKRDFKDLTNISFFILKRNLLILKSEVFPRM